MEATVIVEREGKLSPTLTFGKTAGSFNGISGSFDNAYRDMLATTTGGFSVNEAYTKTTKLTFASGLKLTEQTKYATKYNRTFASVLKLAEKKKHSVRKSLSTAFVVVDTSPTTEFGSISATFNEYPGTFGYSRGFLKLIIRKQLADKFNICDGYSDVIKFNREFKQNLSLKESIKRKFSKPINHTLAVSESYHSNPKKVSIVRLRAVEAGYSRSVVYNRNFAVALAFNEKLKKQFSRPLNDAFGISDFRIGDVETLFIIKKVILTTLDANDSLKKAATHVIDDDLIVKGALSHLATFNRLYDEHISSSDALHRMYALNRQHTISFDDDVAKIIQKPLADSWGIDDDFDRNVSYRRSFAEKHSIGDLLFKRPTKKLTDGVSIYDSNIKASHGVVSNIYIKEGEMSLNDFLTAATKVSGYTAFKEFKVGEYEYQDALVRITMTASDKVKPTAQNVTMHVDIPDTDDKGTVVITKTDGPTQIPFNKSYYTVPEVQVTLKGATTSQGVIIPAITNITTKYFEVELIKGASVLTTGTITWVAKGY